MEKSPSLERILDRQAQRPLCGRSFLSSRRQLWRSCCWTILTTKRQLLATSSTSGRDTRKKITIYRRCSSVPEVERTYEEDNQTLPLVARFPPFNPCYGFENSARLGLLPLLVSRQSASETPRMDLVWCIEYSPRVVVSLVVARP